MHREVQDRRSHRRYRVSLTARMWMSPSGRAVHLPVHDCGRGGLFLVADVLLDVGELVDLDIVVPGDNQPIRALARVAHASVESDPVDGTPPGMGIAFEQLSTDDRLRLTRLLAA